ncbi:hypothetical protein NP493_98g02001 [Ridgeia piscesae]|uniref:Uncharacterized protein n=1 Tax=Ridgeia piscesae TaxID=27915 RepID=A0AAD9P821_RIDPI|nr:hypothetical protein NP493_98g02001 [Ridgeia piscesae]
MPVYFVKAQFYSTNSRICIHCLRFCHDTLRLLCSTISGRFMSRSLFSARRIGKAREHTDVRAKLSLNNVLRTHNIGFQLSNIFIYTAISSTLLQANDTSSRHYLYTTVHRDTEPDVYMNGRILRLLPKVQRRESDEESNSDRQMDVIQY